MSFKKDFEALAESDKDLLHNPNDEQLILKYQEALDKISRLLIHESAIELSKENENLIVNAGNAIYGEIKYTVEHLLPPEYQKAILED